MEKIHCNAQMTPDLIRLHCQVEGEGKRLMEESYLRLKYSARTFHKYLKLARTFADMEGAKKIRKRDVALALMGRDLDKDQALLGLGSLSVRA